MSERSQVSNVTLCVQKSQGQSLTQWPRVGIYKNRSKENLIFLDKHFKVDLVAVHPEPFDRLQMGRVVCLHFACHSDLVFAWFCDFGCDCDCDPGGPCGMPAILLVIVIDGDWFWLWLRSYNVIWVVILMEEDGWGIFETSLGITLGSGILVPPSLGLTRVRSRAMGMTRERIADVTPRRISQQQFCYL